MVTFEALQAQFGDCLLLRYKDKQNKDRLWIIDGGPAGVYAGTLKPRLAALPGPKSKTGDLAADLVLISHIDDDHINGIAAMFAELASHAATSPLVRQLWFNSFSKLLDFADKTSAGHAASLASSGQDLRATYPVTDPAAAAVLASVGQGESVTSDAIGLGLQGPNWNNGNPLLVSPQTLDLAGAKVTVLGPRQARLDKLKKDWKKAAGDKAAQTASLDTSAPNLSSIVVLVEIDGKKILLAGDGRGDDIVAGWLDNGGAKGTPCPVDILKMPHHGSIRNTTVDFLNTFPAQHYVFSANGKYGNPDDDTLKMLVRTQGNRAYTIHVTCDIHQYDSNTDKCSTTRVKDLLDSLKTGRNFDYKIGGGVSLTL